MTKESLIYYCLLVKFVVVLLSVSIIYINFVSVVKFGRVIIFVNDVKIKFIFSSTSLLGKLLITGVWFILVSSL